jgi:hypothetical protein
VFEPHTEEGDLDVEYRVLVHDFMKGALDAVVKLGEGRATMEVSSSTTPSQKPLSGHALRKRQRKDDKAI